MGRNVLYVVALIGGASFYFNAWVGLAGPWEVVWKGVGVALLALWAATRARSIDGWLIAAALALGALGDVLLETHGLTVGAISFLLGHAVAVLLYLRNRAGPYWQAALFAVVVAAISFALPADRAAAPGLALYALFLGAMAGAARISRFENATVAFGALLFVVSDLLIFASLGPMAKSPLPALLIWPTYFAGQALIAWGVVTALEKR